MISARTSGTQTSKQVLLAGVSVVSSLVSVKCWCCVKADHVFEFGICKRPTQMVGVLNFH